MISLYFKLKKADFNKEIPVPRGISPEQARKIVDFMNHGVSNDGETNALYWYFPQINAILTPGDPHDF